MKRGFISGLIVVILAAITVGAVVWWELSQQQASSGSPPSTSSTPTQSVPVTFTYSANKYEFPFGVFHIAPGTTVLGAPYVRVRNTSTATYALLGTDAGTPLADSCYWVVHASIEIAHATLDTTSYADLSPIPTVAVADLVRVVSHDEPQQSCTAP